jgi:hypothetical protein
MILWLNVLEFIPRFQPLTDAAKQYLDNQFKDITKFQDDVMALPLAGVEAVLSRDELQVASEDAVYDFVLKCARAHYPKIEQTGTRGCSAFDILTGIIH